MAADLDPSERERYGRQILSFGEEGQARLKDAHIVVAGAGGLGSPVAIYLAVAGVGRLTLIDQDTVALTNLNRQVLHGEADIGRPKVESGVETLRALNPSIRVEGIRATITDENATALIGDADGIVDAMDNYPTRFVLNRVAQERGHPPLPRRDPRVPRPGHDLRPGPGPLPRLPLSERPAEGGLPRGRRDPRRHRLHPGDRGDQVPDRRGRAPDRPAPALGRARRSHGGDRGRAPDPVPGLLRRRTKMNVTIRFFAQFRERFGPVHELTVPDGARLFDVLHEIAGRTPDGEATLFAPDGTLRDYVIVMKGTERIEPDRVEGTAMHDGETIAVFPPVAGG